jgi:aminomethyltransferase
VKLDKPDFIGKPAIERVKAEGLSRKLAGFMVEGPRVPRHGMEVTDDGRVAGTVTSGGFSPSLERGIGLAYVPTALARNGCRFGVRASGAELAATVAPRPFYQGALHGKPRTTEKAEGLG